MEFKSGYIAVLGRANAGKSSLINSLVGEKVAIVSPKPQTTRNNILGILTKENFQLVFIDTPGIHKTRNFLDKYMMKNVRSAVGGANVLVYLIDSCKKISEEELAYLSNLASKESGAIIVALTKIDLVAYETLLPVIDQISKIQGIDAIIPISSHKNKNMQELLTEILKWLQPYETKNLIFEEDMYTNNSLRFMVGEIIREKALFLLQEEIPHGISAVVIKFEEKQKLTVIECDIICEKDSHKSIIIGKNGTMIKSIGEQARQEIEKLLNTKVLLKLFVVVKRNWRENPNYLTEFGYKSKE